MLEKFIDPRENSLTATVFSHLLHLPADVFWQILRKACLTNSLPPCPGEPTAINYWPKWNPSGTGNDRYVEPDVFLRFAEFDLIIEAKRWDARMQDRNQWLRELQAYTNEYGEENCPVRLIALGGVDNHGEPDDELRGMWSPVSVKRADDGATTTLPIVCPVHACRWDCLLAECQRMEKALAKLPLASFQTGAHRRILADLIDLFAGHGFPTGQWFEDVVQEHPRFGSTMQSYHLTFSTLSSRFQSHEFLES